MLDLAKQGLVEVVPNKGFQVTSISDAELDQITEIRLMLEPPAARTAAGNASAADVDALTPLAQTIVDSAERGDLISYIEADQKFHASLLALGGNRRLVEIVKDLRAQTRRYGLSGLVTAGILAATADEHVTMCTHLAAGDGPALEELVRVHIGHVRREWAGDPGSTRR
jgi:DNA-binding GntR family transcriptional regulator